MNGIHAMTDRDLCVALGRARCMDADATAHAILREMGRRVAEQEILERYHRFAVPYLQVTTELTGRGMQL